MGNVKSNLAAVITAVDVDSKQPITRDIGSPSYDGAMGVLVEFQNLAAAPTAITIPISPAVCVWIRNRSGAATILVHWTPTTGAAADICTLQPGASILLWNPTTGATAGISTLTLTASAANTPVEYYFGA